MRKDLERRLRRLEIAAARLRSGGMEFWVEEDDGMIRGPRGEKITREAFYHLQSQQTGVKMFLFYPEDVDEDPEDETSDLTPADPGGNRSVCEVRGLSAGIDRRRPAGTS